MTSFALIALALLAANPVAAEKPEAREYQLDIGVFEGDPLGSVKAGTLRVVSSPALRTREDEPFSLLIGERCPLPTAPGESPEYIDAGVEASGRVQFSEAGQVRLDFCITVSRLDKQPIANEAVTQSLARVVKIGESVRLVQVVRLGETQKVRIGKASDGDQRWVEVRVTLAPPLPRPAAANVAPVPEIEVGDIINVIVDEKPNSIVAPRPPRIPEAARLSFLIPVAVVDVLPNGNLVLQGRSRILVEGEIWSRSLSGVVRREDVSHDNTALSENIANLTTERTASRRAEEPTSMVSVPIVEKIPDLARQAQSGTGGVVVLDKRPAVSRLFKNRGQPESTVGRVDSMRIAGPPSQAIAPAAHSAEEAPHAEFPSDPASPAAWTIPRPH